MPPQAVGVLYAAMQQDLAEQQASYRHLAQPKAYMSKL
jgi:hypothetical protein